MTHYKSFGGFGGYWSKGPPAPPKQKKKGEIISKNDNVIKVKF